MIVVAAVNGRCARVLEANRALKHLPDVLYRVRVD